MSTEKKKRVPKICLPCWLRRIVKSPYTTLFTALVLLVSGLFEALETVLEDVLNIEIRIYHGVFLFALVQIFIAFEHIMEGLEGIEKIEETEEKEERAHD